MPGICQALVTNQTGNSFGTSNESEGPRYIVSSWTVVESVTDSTLLITQTVGECFVEFLPKDTRIERVYWSFEGPVVRVWTIINTPDFLLEDPIYQAQLAFMDKFPELECDFSVIYRFGKDFNDIKPQGAIEIIPNAIGTGPRGTSPA